MTDCKPNHENNVETVKNIKIVVKITILIFHKNDVKIGKIIQVINEIDIYFTENITKITQNTFQKIVVKPVNLPINIVVIKIYLIGILVQ